MTPQANDVVTGSSDAKTMLREAGALGLSTAALADRAGIDRHKLEDGHGPPWLSAREQWRIARALWDEQAETLLAKSDLPPCTWVSSQPRRNGREIDKHMLSCPTCAARGDFVRATMGPPPAPPAPVFLRAIADSSYEAPLGARVLRGVVLGLIAATGVSALVIVLSLARFLPYGHNVDIATVPLILGSFQGFVLGGGVFYALRPIHDDLLGVLFSGWLTMTVVFFTLSGTILPMVDPPGLPLGQRLFLSAISGTGAGGVLGLGRWLRDAPLRNLRPERRG